MWPGKCRIPFPVNWTIWADRDGQGSGNGGSLYIWGYLWNRRTEIHGRLCAANPGSGTSVSLYILNGADQREITLVIKWNSGADTVAKNAVEVTGKTMLLSELSEPVK